ncbi:MAG TPA: NAD(P)-dependent oxidoreductase [Vicinamibacterales bacterium]|nr:NAD(P)-dependent oxidoreductase [Vicinamibacterales bacterium]
MTAGTAATTFVTGGDGFIGTALVRVLTLRGHRVFALADSAQAAERLRASGAVPVLGSLLNAGAWQDEAGAEWVFHVRPYLDRRPHDGSPRAAFAARARVTTDALLLDTLAAGATRRIVYVADACCYGSTSERPITEDAPLHPSACGRRYGPALDRLEGYLIAGLPIVTAMPGLVYGNGSWFRKRVIDPVLAGRRVIQFGRSDRWVSPIHVDDCARALVHLAEHGHAGRRYFVVNSNPTTVREFAAVFARMVNHPLRVRPLPSAVAPFVASPVLAEYLRRNAVYSNIRLRGTGFHFVYPTLEQGVRQIVESLDA